MCQSPAPQPATPLRPFSWADVDEIRTAFGGKNWRPREALRMVNGAASLEVVQVEFSIKGRDGEPFSAFRTRILGMIGRVSKTSGVRLLDVQWDIDGPLAFVKLATPAYELDEPGWVRN